MENEKDTGILKGQLDELKGILNVIQTQTSSIEQNEYGDMVVFVFLKEIINYLENMNYLSEINLWDRKIFRLNLNKFIVTEKILENDLLLKTVIPVPIDTRHDMRPLILFINLIDVNINIKMLMLIDINIEINI